jgi:hypothetical protein
MKNREIAAKLWNCLAYFRRIPATKIFTDESAAGRNLKQIGGLKVG